MAKKAENTKGNPQNDIFVTSTEIAKLIGKTNKTVQDLTREGILPAIETEKRIRVSRRYNKYETVKAYIKFVEERAAKRSGAGMEDEKLQVEIEIKKTKLKMEQIRLDELEGRMHAAEDVESMTTDLALCIRSNLLAMPGQLAVDLVGINDAAEISAIIQKTVYDILNDLANYEYDPKEYEKRVRERQGWLKDEQGDEENE